MEIDRKKEQGGIGEAIHRISFVLNEIEKIDYNVDDFFRKRWGSRLTHEEIIGALVSAEQSLNDAILGEKE